MKKHSFIIAVVFILLLNACETMQLGSYFNKAKLPLQMVFVEAGDFKMGSFQGFLEERPVHSVTLTRNFFIAKYETSARQVADVYNWGLKNNRIIIEKGFARINSPEKQKLLDLTDEGRDVNFNGKFFYVKPGMENYPCNEISWYGAVVFCNMLSEMENKAQAYNLKTWTCDFNSGGYRLPTEAEWEYACIGGKKSKGYLFAGSNDPFIAAWFDKNGARKIHPIGLKIPNELKLYDMSGNVWEWCYDNFNRLYYYFSPDLDPKGPTRGINRAIRGGSIQFNAFTCRCTTRFLNSDPASTGNFGGFRVVQTANFEVAAK